MYVPVGVQVCLTYLVTIPLRLEDPTVVPYEVAVRVPVSLSTAVNPFCTVSRVYVGDSPDKVP